MGNDLVVTMITRRDKIFINLNNLWTVEVSIGGLDNKDDEDKTEGVVL